MVIAGDTIDLNLDNILAKNPQFIQIVKEYTRLNPPRILDPIIMTLACYYQPPQCLDPLDPDRDKDGKKSDHKIVIARPISSITNKNARISRQIKVRPIPQSGINQMREWLIDEAWEGVYSAVTAHEKASIFQNIILQKYETIFPEKIRKFSDDD